MKGIVKRRYLFVLVVALVALAVLMIPASDEPKKGIVIVRQISNCKQVLGCILAAQAANGEFPENYESAVAEFSRDSDAWASFRKSKDAKPLQWLYQRPDSAEQVCIVSPTPVEPWSGAASRYIVGYANGRVEAQVEGKLSEETRKILAEQGVTAKSGRSGE